MSFATPFAGDVKGRLLPASIPFRFFLAALVFHAAGWLMLLIAAPGLPGFAGGTGLVLAAIHLLTLGVLAMTAIGASYQLLPVVTRQPLARTGPARLSFWLMLAGVPVLALGMAVTSMAGLYTGAALVASGLAIFALLTGENLSRAGSLPVVAAHGWGALIALGLVVGAGFLLIADFATGMLSDHPGLADIHMILAVFGFMGLLVAGFSQILIPMFALSGTPPARPGWWHLGLAGTAIAGFVAGIAFDAPALLLASGVVGLAAAGVYVQLMRASLRAGMRKRLGVSFLLIRASWGFLGLGLLIGLALLAGVAIPNGAALFGFVILAGWLLTFLLGILQRIMPFLASMHISGKGGRPPLLSDLAPDGPLRVHAAFHFAALASVSAGIVADAPMAIRFGAVLGVAGAVSFGVFAGFIAARLAAK